MHLKHRARVDNEEGAVLVMFAFSLVILMMFAAFVIDIGAAYLERRQDQTAADAGVLAAGALLASNEATSKDQVGQTAVELARINLAAAPTAAEWDAAFASCTDPGRDLTEYPAGPSYTPVLSSGAATDCVHFNASFTRIRIRIPNRSVPTTFARVIGIGSLTVHAEAEAQIIVPPSRRGIPFAVANGEGNPNDLLCVRLDTSCSGPTNQGTRIVDSPLMGNTTIGTTRSCGTMFSPPGDGNPGADTTIGTRAANNAAVGFDHTIVTYSSGDPVRSDDFGPSGPCATRMPTPLPNYGYATQIDNLVSNWPAAATEYMNGVADGVVFGSSFSDGGTARLRRLPAGWSQVRTIDRDGTEYVVDDRPLWDYIDPAASNIPGICQRATFDADPTIQHVVDCLNAFNGLTHDPLFALDSDGDGTYDIEESPRAGFFPLVGTPGGTSYPPAPILGFQLGFINTMYFGTGTSPDVEYSAGDDPADPDVIVDGMNLVGLAIFRIEDAMLPGSARPMPPNQLTATVSLTR